MSEKTESIPPSNNKQQQRKAEISQDDQFKNDLSLNFVMHNDQDKFSTLVPINESI